MVEIDFEEDYPEALEEGYFTHIIYALLRRFRMDEVPTRQ